MRLDEMTQSTVVAIADNYAWFNIGNFPKGAMGTVVAYHPDAKDDPVAIVRMHDHYAELDDWDNELHVYRYADACAEVTERAFTLVWAPAIGDYDKDLLHEARATIDDMINWTDSEIAHFAANMDDGADMPGYDANARVLTNRRAFIRFLRERNA